MARLLMCGWETGDIAQLGVASGTSGLYSVVSSTPSPRSGAYCLKCAASIGSYPVNGGVTIAHATQTELYYAFGLYRSNNADSAFGPPNQYCFTAYDTAGVSNILLSLEQDGAMRAYYGTTPTLISGSTTATIPLNTWTLIELHVIASTTTTGTCELKVNGTVVFSVSSVRTAQTTANFGGLRLEYRRNFTGNTSSFTAFDDLRINTTAGTTNTSWPGDGKIVGLVPNGVGTTIGGTPLTPTGSGTNWQNVDELPPSTTDYNSGTTVGTGETYALSDPSTVGTCQAVNVLGYVLNVDNGGGSVGLTVKTPAGTSEGTAQPITVTPSYYNRILETDPSDSAAWTSAKLTALEAGITVR